MMKKTLIYLLAAHLIFGSCKAQTGDINLFGTTVNYETGTVLLTSVNTALTAFNLAGINPKWQTQYTQGAAIVTGAAQLAYGMYEAGSDFSTLNVVNITAGAATIVTNAILLYQTFHSGGKTSSWNLYIAPVDKNNPDFGFRIVKYFKI